MANIQEAVKGCIETLIQERLPVLSGVKATDEPTVTVVVSAA